MTYSLEFSEADGALIQSSASLRNISAQAFITEAAMKAARNAAYLAKIDRGIKQIEEGTGVHLTWEQLYALRDGKLTREDLEALRGGKDTQRRGD